MVCFLSIFKVSRNECPDARPWRDKWIMGATSRVGTQQDPMTPGFGEDDCMLDSEVPTHPRYPRAFPVGEIFAI